MTSFGLWGRPSRRQRNHGYTELAMVDPGAGVPPAVPAQPVAGYALVCGWSRSSSTCTCTERGVLMRLLVVEDEPKMAGLLRRALVEEGYAVDVADTGDRGY